ncbi:hypothetical protein GH892_02700 [Bacillus thuringiensis]|uniref:hypothetical protein n=1 Tax=Bacillus toyonensis TaxID=155322 RepID=UPI001298A247|nr:hypothetical protein [Bacillus thuringiensis]
MAKPRFLMRNDEVNTANEEVIIDETVTPMEDVQKDTANEVEVDNKETSENKVDVIEPKTELPLHKETDNVIEDESETVEDLEDTKVEDDKATATDVEDGLVDKPTVNEVPKEVSPIEGNVTEEVVNEETTEEIKEEKPKEEVADVKEQEEAKDGKVTIDEVKVIDDAEKEKIVDEVTDKVIEGMKDKDKDKDKEGLKDEIKEVVKEVVDEIIKEKQDKTNDEIKEEAKDVVEEVVEEKPTKVEPNPTSKDYPKWKDRFLRNWATIVQLRKVCNLKKITPPEFEYLTDEKY